MQIDERVVDGVTILDLKGKMTLGEGDELLKDKINSLIQQDRKKLLLNLEGVPYIDSAGLGEIVRTYTTVSRQGGKLKLLNLTKRIQDLLAITKLLTVFETYDSEAGSASRASPASRPHGPPRARSRMARHTLPDITERGRAAAGAAAGVRAGRWPSACSSRCARPVDEEPDRLRGADVRPAAARPAAVALCASAAFVDLLRAVGRRLPGQRRRRSRRGPAPPAQATSADRLGRRLAGAGARPRRSLLGAVALGAAFWLRPRVRRWSRVGLRRRCWRSTRARSSTS